MTQSTNARIELIKKLLNKAEAKGTTQAERDTYNAKAAELMLQWGIESAMLNAGSDKRAETIITMTVQNGAPKSYSYEMTLVGIAIAESMSCRGLLQRARDGRTNMLIVGHESDVHRVDMLFAALTRQCAMELGIAYNHRVRPHWSGTEKFKFKRAFIVGYADGIKYKMKAAAQTVMANAAPGTDLVLVDRKAAVKDWMARFVPIGTARGRAYGAGARGLGTEAGLRADVGTGRLGNSTKSVGA